MEIHQNIENELNHPMGHPEMEGGDASQCPHLQFMNKSGQDPEKNANFSKKKNTENEDYGNSDSDVSSDDEEKPTGGCPVMGANKAKDPRLEILKPGFE